MDVKEIEFRIWQIIKSHAWTEDVSSGIYEENFENLMIHMRDYVMSLVSRDLTSFEILGKMSDDNKDICLAPLSNIVSIDIKGTNGEVTIGVPRDVAQDLIDDKEFVGGLVLANKKQFEEYG